MDQQNITRAGYEIRDASFTLIGYAESLIAARGPDAVGIAKAHGKDCIVIRCSDQTAIMGYGTKPARLLARWRSETCEGMPRMVA